MTESEKQAAQQMVETQITARGVDDPAVLQAIQNVPRTRFIPTHLHAEAWADRPLPIGNDQTISQPYIVALMSSYIAKNRKGKVLEIGTGCGYQTAVLAELFAEVYSLEIIEDLHRAAKDNLENLGYLDDSHLHLRCGDGFAGWPEAAPFDAIILTAAPADIPQPLLDQLAEGGRLIGPVGREIQELILYERNDGQLTSRRVGAVRFVPMTGEARGER